MFLRAGNFLVVLDKSIAVSENLVVNHFVVLDQRFGVYNGSDDLPHGIPKGIFQGFVGGRTDTFTNYCR